DRTEGKGNHIQAARVGSLGRGWRKEGNGWREGVGEGDSTGSGRARIGDEHGIGEGAVLRDRIGGGGQQHGQIGGGAYGRDSGGSVIVGVNLLAVAQDGRSVRQLAGAIRGDHHSDGSS